MASSSSSSSSRLTLPMLPPISSITDLLDRPLPEHQPLPPPRSRINSLKGLFSSIRDSRSRIKHQRTKGPKVPSAPALPSSLAPPVDITTTLLDRGMKFNDARAVSSAFIDQGVKVQFASQQRHAKTQKNALRRARTSKVMENIGHFQEKLRNTQQKIYNSDLHSLFRKTMGMVETTFPAPTVVDLSDSDDDEEAEEQPRRVVEATTDNMEDEVAEETVEDDDIAAPASKEEQNAMGELTPEITAVLIDIYNNGFVFPDRQEKIKLAQATNLTYRQIGIWFSNRRDRQRKAEAKASRYNEDSESEFEYESDEYSDIEVIERPAQQDCDESESCVGTDDEEEIAQRTAPSRKQSAIASRVPSMTMSMTTASSSSPDHWIDSWLATDEQAPFVEVAQYVNNDELTTGSMADMFDFTLPTTSTTTANATECAPAPSSIAFQDLSSLAQSSQSALPMDTSLLPAPAPSSSSSSSSYHTPPAPAPMSDPFSKSSSDFLAGFLAGAALNLPHVPQPFNPTAMTGPQLAPLAIPQQLPTPQTQSQQPSTAGPSSLANSMFNSPPFNVSTSSSPVAGYGAKRGIESVEDDDDVVEVNPDSMDESDDDIVEIPAPASVSRAVQAAPPAKRAKTSAPTSSRPPTASSKASSTATRSVKTPTSRARVATDSKAKAKAAPATKSGAKGRKKIVSVAPTAPRRLAPAPIAPRPSSVSSTSTSSGSTSPFNIPILPLPPYPLQRIRPVHPTPQINLAMQVPNLVART
ncbi:hypothetical protein FRB98_004516 [Tulasnella sp. 332]|nr:hypothetical protein FRB98_004516 [Tulasnella sp. 332]